MMNNLSSILRERETDAVNDSLRRSELVSIVEMSENDENKKTHTV